MTSQTTIKKLPPIKEDVNTLKQRVQDLEREVVQYKSRLEELRKAKNNLIIKKTTEYVKTGTAAQANNREKSNATPQEVEQALPVNSPYNEELEKMVQTLQDELGEARNLIAALKLENEELKNESDRNKKQFDEELARSMNKNEEYKREIKQWEVMYKEWMQMMEDRVTNINRTHQILQECIRPPEDSASN
ncbi:ELKS Rab6-interacting CAST family member 1-like [Brachionus plicatilis]|uniref:ELKS Rab6-interacting CAST family member 1-like n=1 Tax=Brachionus plicatilis TaxID=10195 RepID=A0A3M7QQ44_BRAPC|nr:ELKS Rab6-interacting CAST family member 1-like [Brachionus plicatilis]